MSIGKRIKELREKGRLSQAALAKEIGVSSGNVGDWERDKAKPGADALISLRSFFNKSTDWLLTGEESVQREQSPKYHPDKLGPPSELEKEMLWMFRQLDARDQDYARANIEMLYKKTSKGGTSSNSMSGGTGEEAAASETA